jgi:hypothetical protein
MGKLMAASDPGTASAFLDMGSFGTLTIFAKMM